MEKRQFDVTALGELLIDFTENGFSSQGNPLMEANPGGAPCNVLAMLERLGKKTAFIGKVGKDMFGNQLKSAVEEVGIDTRNLILDEKYHTTLAFVHTYPDGDRDFSFYRDPGADMMLTKDEVQKEQGDPAAQRAAARYDPEPQPPDPKRQPAEDPEPEIVQFPVLYAGGAEDAVQQRGRRHRQDGLAEKVF